ncbi:MAG TPA: DUF4040 domain-containing protein [Rickettsia endosymbiont of Pyrocoelia pectoralis]|nr:DUF4040 domain-containing protein [Rickettsia endosymbiont of Pyrocoelia pectoralis]
MEIKTILNFDLSNYLLNLIVFLLIVISIKIIIAKDLLEAVIFTSIFSLLIGLSYLLMDAPDVAMTEAALGACLSTCVYLNLLRKLPPDLKNIQRTKIIPASLICLLFIGTLVYMGLELPNYGDENTPLQTGVTKYYLENTKQDIGVPSFVAAILASYRGYDTLGETSVILIAGIAVLLILSLRKVEGVISQESWRCCMDNFCSCHLVACPRDPVIKKYKYSKFLKLKLDLSRFILDPVDKPRDDTEYVFRSMQQRQEGHGMTNPIIKYLTIFIVPYIILYSLYIQLNGESSPGGGFQAGVIFASGLIAYDLVYEKRYFSINSLISIAVLGVMIYGVTGAISLFFNDNYLNYYSLTNFTNDKLLAQHIGIFAVEIGIGLTVSSVMYLIYNLLNYE